MEGVSALSFFLIRRYKIMMVLRGDIAAASFDLNRVVITYVTNETVTFNYAAGLIGGDVKDQYDNLQAGDILSIAGLAGNSAIFNGSYTVTSVNSNTNVLSASRSFQGITGTPSFTGTAGQRTFLREHAHLAVGTHIFPADRCTWVQENAANGSGYDVTQAFFYSGNDDPLPISSPELGYIGKSGRFVKITS